MRLPQLVRTPPGAENILVSNGQAPPKLTRLSLIGEQAKPYPLSWSEQDALIKALPRHLADTALFAVNTGCRDQEACQLRWEW
jgi:integrase